MGRNSGRAGPGRPPTQKGADMRRAAGPVPAEQTRRIVTPLVPQDPPKPAMPTTSHPPLRAFGDLAALLSGDSFWPTQPPTLEQAGLSDDLIEALVLKRLLAVGRESGRALAEHVCLPMGMLEDVFQRLRTRQLMTHK